MITIRVVLELSFNGHPPLGVNATRVRRFWKLHSVQRFQRAPTLGGECYSWTQKMWFSATQGFQRAPTLGGECYRREK